MKTKRINIFLALVAVMVLVMAGCGMPRHIIQAEVSRQEAVTNPSMRAGSTLLLVQPYRSTWAIVRVYKGSMSRDQAIGNVNGRIAFYSDYVAKIELTNAIQYNMPNPGNIPNTDVLLLDPDATYTIVVYVGHGRSIFEKMYVVDVRYIRTGHNPIESSWTDRWGRQWMANQVLIIPGTNEPSMSSLNLNFKINAAEIMRDAGTRFLGGEK